MLAAARLGGVFLSVGGSDVQRRARILTLFNAALLVGGIPFLVVDTWMWLARDVEHGAYNAVTSLVFCAAIIAIWLVCRMGHVTIAALLHLAVMSVGLVAFFLHTEPSLMNVLFVEPAIVAAFVLRPSAGFIAAAVSSLSFSLLNVQHGTPFHLDLQMTLGLFGVAMMSWIGASYLEWTAAALNTTTEDLERGRAAYRRADKERGQIQEALAAAEQQTRVLFENAPAGIMLFDTDSVVTECNERFAEISGIARDSIVGMNYSLEGDQRARAAMEEALRGNVGSFEGSAPGPTGSREKWISFTASPLLGTHHEVTGGIGVLTDLTDRKQGEELVERLAFYDPLTGLANRRLLLDRIQQAIERTPRGGKKVTVAVLNIDNFRAVNESLGSPAGDKLLKGIVLRLQPLLKRSDTLARIGGDEFALLTIQADRLNAAVTVAERIQEAFREPWEVDGEVLQATASLGFASYSSDTRDAQALLDNAAIAMRRAKSLGRDTCQFHDPTMNIKVANRIRRERELRLALSEGQFHVFYQPQVDLRTGLICGAEALMRWVHPERGIVSPAEFIPLAEEIGLVGRLDGLGITASSKEATTWCALSGRRIRLAVNVSPLHLHSPEFLPHLTRACESSGLSPASLEIELTETAILGDASRMTQILMRLRQLGVTVALDDFGTGYSSLSHLHQLPIQAVKIDRSFVSRLETDASAAAIVKAVNELAHSLGLLVVAEGLETVGQLRIVQAMGCDIGQGYLFSKPLPSGAFRDLLVDPGFIAEVVVVGEGEADAILDV